MFSMLDNRIFANFFKIDNKKNYRYEKQIYFINRCASIYRGCLFRTKFKSLSISG